MQQIYKTLLLAVGLILFFAATSVHAQTIIPIPGDPTLFCLYLNGTSSVAIVDSAGYSTINPSKTLNKLKKKRQANSEIIKGLKNDLAKIPKTGNFADKRAKIQNTINRLQNQVNANKITEGAISKCKKNIPLEPDYVKVVLVDSVNVSGERVIGTIAIRKKINYACGKGCKGTLTAGSWCITYTSSGEIPYSGSSGKEVQVLFYEANQIFDSMQPNAPGNVVANDEIWSPLFQAKNPSNPTDAKNQVIARTGDLTATSRPILGKACGSLK